MMFTVFGAFLSGGIILLPRRYRYAAAFFVIVVAVGVNIRNFRPTSYEFVDRYVPEDPCGTSWGFEYLPTSVKTCLKTSWDTPYRIEAGDIHIISARETARRGEFETSSTTKSVLLWGRYYLPGWNAFIDGKETRLVPSYPYGLGEIEVPPGKHAIEFVLRPTRLQRISNAISLGTLIGVVISFGLMLRRKLRV